eukprot:1136136-Pelagomonas_calceolata.AAC.5
MEPHARRLLWWAAALRTPQPARQPRAGAEVGARALAQGSRPVRHCEEGQQGQEQARARARAAQHAGGLRHRGGDHRGDGGHGHRLRGCIQLWEGLRTRPERHLHFAQSVEARGKLLVHANILEDTFLAILNQSFVNDYQTFGVALFSKATVQGNRDLVDQYGFTVPGNPLDRLPLDKQFGGTISYKNSTDDPANSLNERVNT